jgi:hypothetical protein
MDVASALAIASLGAVLLCMVVSTLVKNCNYVLSQNNVAPCFSSL